MDKIEWEKTLKINMYMLISAYKKEKNYQKKRMILNDLLTIKSYFSKKVGNGYKRNLLSEYRETKHFYQDIDFLWEDILRFSTCSTKGISNKFDISNIEMNSEEMLQLANDFYSSLDSEYYSYFSKVFAKRKRTIGFLDEPDNDEAFGRTFFLNYFKESFIIINHSSTVEDLFTLVHEFAHATSLQMNPNHLYPPKSVFGEIDTYFIELVFADYLCSLNIIDERYMRFEFGCNVVEAKSIVNKIELIKTESFFPYGFNSSKLLLKTGSLMCDLNYEEVLSLFDSSEEVEISIIGFMYALKLYEIYKKDKKKAMDILKQFIFMKCNTEKEYYEKLRELGLNLDSFGEIHKHFVKPGPILALKKQE